MTDWPFLDPRNFNAFSTRQVMEQGDPILLVSHDAEDGAWQFIGGPWGEQDLVVICLEHAVHLDPSVCELADLPRGWSAQRGAPGQPWQRSPSPSDQE